MRSVTDWPSPWPLIPINEVWHVGALEDRAKDALAARTSFEANLLSVSEHPEDWAGIARCGGRTWTLSRPGGLWLDALSLDDSHLAPIREWGLSAGLVERATIWRAWRHDCETEMWGYSEHASEVEARAELDGDEIDQIDAPSPDGSSLEPVEGLVLTRVGLAGLERWASPFDAEAGLIILWARDRLAAVYPDLVGVWWCEEHAPEALSCPRGGIFPDRLDEFLIHDECGAVPPIRETDGSPSP